MLPPCPTEKPSKFKKFMTPKIEDFTTPLLVKMLKLK